MKYPCGGHAVRLGYYSATMTVIRDSNSTDHSRCLQHGHSLQDSTSTALQAIAQELSIVCIEGSSLRVLLYDVSVGMSGTHAM